MAIVKAADRRGQHFALASAERRFSHHDVSVESDGTLENRGIEAH